MECQCLWLLGVPSAYSVFLLAVLTVDLATWLVCLGAVHAAIYQDACSLPIWHYCCPALPCPAAPPQVGWGFTDAMPFTQQPDITISPQQKREHLYSFWQQNIGRPMALVGGSLGGAIALDFALAYPEAVDRLVLIDAQVRL